MYPSLPAKLASQEPRPNRRAAAMHFRNVLITAAAIVFAGGAQAAAICGACSDARRHGHYHSPTSTDYEPGAAPTDHVAATTTTDDPAAPTEDSAAGVGNGGACKQAPGPVKF